MARVFFFFFVIFSWCGTVVSMTGSLVLHAKPALAWMFTTVAGALKRAKSATTQARLHHSRHARLAIFRDRDQDVQKRTGRPRWTRSYRIQCSSPPFPGEKPSDVYFPSSPESC